MREHSQVSFPGLEKRCSPSIIGPTGLDKFASVDGSVSLSGAVEQAL